MLGEVLGKEDTRSGRPPPMGVPPLHTTIPAIPNHQQTYPELKLWAPNHFFCGPPLEKKTREIGTRRGGVGVLALSQPLRRREGKNVLKNSPPRTSKHVVCQSVAENRRIAH